MTDVVDKAQPTEDLHLSIALARAGIKRRETEIPPPAFCRTCGGKPEVGALCGPCSHQLDKGGR